MSIVKVVGRADGDKIDLLFTTSAEFIQVSVETLGLSKEGRIGKKTIDDSDTVEPVKCSNKVVTGIFYCSHMTGGDIAGRPDQCKVVNSILLDHANVF